MVFEKNVFFYTTSDEDDYFMKTVALDEIDKCLVLSFLI